MKKVYLGLMVLVMLGMAACQSGPEELPPLPTLAVTPEVPEVSEVTDAPEVTNTPDKTEQPMSTVTPQATAIPVPTEEPQATPIPKSTATPQPTATPTQVSIPTPTATPKPTEALKPTITPTSTMTPTPTTAPKSTATPIPTVTPGQVPPEISKLLEKAEEHSNTMIRGTVCENKEQANEYVREMAFEYRSFGVIVEDVSDLCSAKEYMELYPEIETMVIEKIDIYRNGICATIADVTVSYDAELCYAIRTDNRSVLSDTQKKIYAYLKDVVEETKAGELDRIEAVKALHDHLVLELKYDESFQVISHSPEGVMKNKTAVCDGYARTMRLLLLMIGIENRIVGGTAGNESHAWNLVKMEDGWYHMDVTWDDPIPDVEGKVSYLYFLKNDADMAKTHTWESEIVCNGNAYQMYMYQSVLCDSFESLREIYERQIQTEQYLLFCYPKNGNLTQDMILEFVQTELRMGISYYPEKEQGNYMVLEIVNPLLEN